MRALAVIALVACGSSDPPAPQASIPPSLEKPTLLGEAARLAKAPSELIALARAYAARGDVAAARSTLSRVQPGKDVVLALGVVDVRIVLGDAANVPVPDAPTETLVAALAAVESKAALAAVAVAVAHSADFESIIDAAVVNGDLTPGTARWDAVATAVGSDAPKLVVLATRARRLRAAGAKPLLLAAAKTGGGFDLAIELALDGEPKLARAIGNRPYSREHDYWVDPRYVTSMDRVLDAIDHALLEAILGDKSASKAWETKAPTLATFNLDFLENQGGQTRRFEDDVNCGFAIAEELRGESAQARVHFRELASAGVSGCVFELADLNRRRAAEETALDVPDRDRPRAFAGIIEIDLLLGELADAQQLAVANGGLDTVALAYAHQGDVESMTRALALDHSPTAPVTRLVARMQLAWSLARTGKCDRARPLASELANAITYAIVARYCPP